MNVSFMKTESSGNLMENPPGLYKNRTFICLLAGHMLTVMGNNFHSMALSLWILQRTGSAKLMSSILIIHILMNLIFGSMAGTMADRMDRRKLMWTADVLRGVLVLGIAGCVAAPDISFVFIMTLTAVVALAGLLQGPAMQASLLQIVGQLNIQRATGIMSIADNAARISGFALGGAFIGIFGGAVAIVADACAFFLSALLVLAGGRFPSPVGEQEEKSSFWSDLKAGFEFVVRDSFARAVTLISPLLIMFFVTSLMLVQVMAVKVWQVKAAAFGLLEACIPTGYLLGSFMILLLDKRLKRRGWWICGGIVLSGPVFIAVSILRSSYAAIPLILVAGILFSFSTLLVHIILRIRVRPDLQGRVFGLMGSLGSVAPPLGLSAASFLADWLGSPLTLLLNGIGFLLLGILVVAAAKQVLQFD